MINPTTVTARQPRHQAAPTAGLVVKIERASGSAPAEMDAQLADISRRGLRVKTCFPLQMNEAITVRIEHPASALSVVVAGVVRWQKGEEDNWSIGCQFNSPLELATLGELFLNDILSVKPS
jgi:hypothetical protein